MNIPGTTIECGSESDPHHPIPEDDVRAIFTHKREYLERYQSDYLPYLAELKESWEKPAPNLVGRLKAWFEPWMVLAPTLCDAIGAPCLLVAGDTEVFIDFGKRQVRAHDGAPFGFRFDIDRRLVETVVAQNAVDWSDKLFLSCRFGAWRSGPYNEYLYNFFKSLSVERMQRTEAEAVRKIAPPEPSDEIRIGDHIVERYCPHRRADLSVFGESDGTTLVCTLHGWKFDLETGRCLTADDRRLRVRRADS
jgi:UDP-MurNAc hydroxylase